MTHRATLTVSGFALLGLVGLLTGCGSYAGTVEDLRFTGDGGITLQASLIKPEGAGPWPAIVLLSGAELATRDRMIYRKTGNVFLERGLAVLVYDKRGAGDSGGDPENTTYAQLVGDAVGAIDLLRQQPEIDSERIGVLGVSESGWLTPEINERVGGLAFVINKSGAPLSVRETVAWEVYNDLMADGVEEASAREQTEVYRRLWEYRIAPTDAERVALRQTLDQWEHQPDSQLPTEIREVDADYVADISYDPTPFLERMTTPTLYLYGTEDINIPSAASVVRLDELIADGRPISYHVFPGEGHELGGFRLSTLGYEFVDGYADLIGDFAERHTSTSDPTPPRK
ncbi:MAG: hypothetical protein HKN29_13955 [Rhodothermales bacterium]|nr:hypothetical protein [Rhodothermales bacterium]